MALVADLKPLKVSGRYTQHTGGKSFRYVEISRASEKKQPESAYFDLLIYDCRQERIERPLIAPPETAPAMSSEEMRRLGVEVVRAVRERFPKGALDHPRYPRRNPARKLSAAMDFAIEYERALRRANHTLARLSPETATYLFEQLAAAYVSGPTGVVTRDSMAFTVLAEIVRRATKPMRVGITEYDDSRRGTHPFVFMYAPGAGEPWVVDAWAQCPSVAPLSQTQFAKRGCGRMLTMETRTPLRLFGVPRDFSKNEPGLDVYAHYLDERSQQPLQELPYQPVRPCPEDFSILTRWPSRYQVPIGSDPYTDVAPDSWLVGPLALIVTLFLIFRVGRVPNRVGRVPNRRLRFYARILAGAM